jgi:hypothetical protein
LPYGAQLGGPERESIDPEDFEFYHELEFRNGTLIRAKDVTNEAFGQED